jgi:hypothetical protein
MSSLERTLQEISQRADWRRAHHLYRQFSAIVGDPDRPRAPSDDIVGALAEALARVFAAYEDSEREFLDDLAALFGDVDGLPDDPVDRFRRLYKDTRLDRIATYTEGQDGRRRPRPFEAAVETVRRIDDLNRLRDVLELLPSSAILGGSMSYGRFYNVGGAGAGKPSDTDLLLVVPTYGQLEDVARALRRLDFISPASLAQLDERIEKFESIRAGYENCTFVQKLQLWEEQTPPVLRRYQIPGYYLVALHVMSLDDFQFVALRDIPALETGLALSLREYRDDRPSGNSNELRCFAGYTRTVDQPYEPVDNGFVAQEPIAEIRDDRFFPGVHLNLILPQFEVRWEAPQARVRLTLLNLRWKVLARLDEERRMRSYEIQRVSMSHTRSGVFAPHIARRADRT